MPNNLYEFTVENDLHVVWRHNLNSDDRTIEKTGDQWVCTIKAGKLTNYVATHPTPLGALLIAIGQRHGVLLGDVERNKRRDGVAKPSPTCTNCETENPGRWLAIPGTPYVLCGRCADAYRLDRDPVAKAAPLREQRLRTVLGCLELAEAHFTRQTGKFSTSDDVRRNLIADEAIAQADVILERLDR